MFGHYSFENIIGDLYQQKFDEFVALMQNIFEQPTIDVKELLKTVDRDIEQGQLLEVHVKVVDKRANIKLNNLRLTVYDGLGKPHSIGDRFPDSFVQQKTSPTRH